MFVQAIGGYCSPAATTQDGATRLSTNLYQDVCSTYVCMCATYIQSHGIFDTSHAHLTFPSQHSHTTFLQYKTHRTLTIYTGLTSIFPTSTCRRGCEQPKTALRHSTAQLRTDKYKFRGMGSYLQQLDGASLVNGCSAYYYCQPPKSAIWSLG